MVRSTNISNLKRHLVDNPKTTKICLSILKVSNAYKNFQIELMSLTVSHTMISSDWVRLHFYTSIKGKCMMHNAREFFLKVKNHKIIHILLEYVLEINFFVPKATWSLKYSDQYLLLQFCSTCPVNLLQTLFLKNV